MPRPAPVFALLALVLLAIVAYLAGRDVAPAMPGDADHEPSVTERRCLECHAHDARKPRPVDHPLRDDCYSCHRDAAGRLHPRQGAPTELPRGWPADPRMQPRAQDVR